LSGAPIETMKNAIVIAFFHAFLALQRNLQHKLFVAIQ